MAKKQTEGGAADASEQMTPEQIERAIRNSFNAVEVFGEDKDVADVRHTEDILNLKIVVTGYKPLKGDRGDYYFIYAIDADKKQEFGFACGGVVVREKLAMAKEQEKLPIKVKIVKVKEYYDLKPW